VLILCGRLLIKLSGASVKLGKKIVGIKSGRMAGAMHSSHIICNVLAETEGLDRMAGKVAGADQTSAEEEEDFGRPQLLGVASVPQIRKEVLLGKLASVIVKVDMKH
jgi:hypothetical protein